MLHAGTLFAVTAYFLKDWINLLKEGFLSLKEGTFKGIPERKIFWLLIIATIPAAFIGKMFEAETETVFRNPGLISLTMVGFAILFFLVDRKSPRTKTLHEINIADAILIGISQALAIIPGVSRSGITIVTALGLKFNREAATKFSFLLSAPIILGATLINISKIIGSTGKLNLLIGFLGSAVSGLLAIHFLLSFVKRHTFNLFVIYRIIFGLSIMSVLFFRH